MFGGIIRLKKKKKCFIIILLYDMSYYSKCYTNVLELTLITIYNNIRIFKIFI